MTAAGRHRRILASAGTGKTWQLTTQYLGILLAAGDPKPETILASTFTRAAAGEIRARVLQRLAIASRDDAAGEQERAGLRKALALEAPQVTPAKCLALLRAILERLDRLQVRTLDSFLFGVAAGSSSELGLPMPLEPLDEHGNARLQLEAVDSAITTLGKGGPEALIATLDDLTEGHPGRGVESLVETAAETLATLAEDAPASAWSWPLPEAPAELDFADLVDRLLALAAEVEARKELGGLQVAKAIRTTAECVGEVRDLQRSGASIPLEAWIAVLGKGICKPLTLGGGSYYRKQLHPRICESLAPVIRRAAWEIERIALRRTKASALLARRVHDERERLLASRSEVTYDRVTRAVATYLAEHPYSELLERIDAKVEHLLLDEFQDTSRIQWQALRPLASEIAASSDGSRSFFAVGDLKQSIYGWRGGDPEILEHLGDRFDAGRGGVEFEPESLDESRRSSPPVLAAVNQVFGALGTNEVANRVSTLASKWWSSVFNSHRAHDDRSGIAELHLVARGDGEAAGVSDEGFDDGSEGRGGEAVGGSKLRAVCDLVQTLAAHRPGARIGIVVRRNREVARLLAGLRSAGVEAIGIGGGSLRDSAAVNAVLEWLRFLEQPDHTIAAFHVGASPLGSVVGLERRSDRATRLRVAELWRQRISVAGYASVLEELRGRLASSLDGGDCVRWERLMREAALRDQAGWIRPIELMQAAESIRVSEESSALVTVLNIHQAKGLEFDSVICPDLEFTLKPRAAVLVSRGGDGSVIQVVRRIAGLEFVPSLAQIRNETDAMQVRETLCCLYVALTRARDRLFMLVDAPKENEKTIPATAAGLLRASLAPAATEPGVVWRSGDEAWREVLATDLGQAAAEAGEGSEATKAAALEAARPLTFAFADGGSARTRRAAPPSSHASASLAQTMALGDSDAADRGTAIHALFETIGFVEDGVPDDSELELAIRRSLPRRESAWRAERIAEFRTMLAKPAITACLARPSDGLAQVWRERRFVAVDGGAVRQGIIDRLVAVGEPGGWRRAEILDFKTDAFDGTQPSEEALAAKVELYRGQLLSYRSEIAKQFRLDPASIAMRLVLVAPGVVRDVPDR